MITQHRQVIGFGLALALAWFMPNAASADDDDPPGRVARLAYAAGAVSFQPSGTDDWVAATVNRPLTTGDALWSDRDGRVELELDGSLLRLADSTAVTLLNLSDNVTQIQLSSGTLIVRVRRLDDNETYEIDTPNLAFSILRPGLYRLTVDESGASTDIRVRSGQGEVTGGGTAYTVQSNEDDFFSGTDPLTEEMQSGAPNEDSFDAWSAGRDGRWEHSLSSRYVSPDIVGYEDLDDQGAWRPTPDYGNVWFPTGVEVGWAPYHSGHWSYIAPWGYTWVDDRPWGFAPFHYGRWVSVGGAWGWIPTPPRPTFGSYVRPVYAPALVAWVGVGTGVAWFALGPREVYVPSYPVSRRYIENINVSNTTVNTTVINNVYNTTVINNKTVNVTNVNYVNRHVPGAVAAVTSQAFNTAQPVSRNLVKVDARDLSSAPVRAVAPASVPTKQAVLGSARMAAAKPPAVLQTRPIVARTAPPPPQPTFEKREQAIQTNAGRPLSVSQARQIQSSGTARRAPVRLAPAATPLQSYAPKPAAAPNQANASRTSGAPNQANASRTSAAPNQANASRTTGAPNQANPPRPAPTPNQASAPKPAASGIAPPKAEPWTGTSPARDVTANRPPSVAVHPNELPEIMKPASPSIANSALERQHLQQQQQLLARQEQERQRVQQEQELAHQRLAQQQAEEAQRRQAAQQQQQQAQQAAQRQQQQAQQAAQQQQRAEQEAERQRAQQQAELARQEQARQQADEARRQQIEQQHQQQTQQLAQQHALEQEQLQKAQQEERRAQESQTKPAVRKPSRPP